MLKLFKKRSTNEEEPGVPSRAVPDEKGDVKKKPSGSDRSSGMPEREEKARPSGPSQAIENLTSAVADLDLGEAGPQEKPTKKKASHQLRCRTRNWKWVVRYCLPSYSDRNRRNSCYQESITRSSI